MCTAKLVADKENTHCQSESEPVDKPLLMRLFTQAGQNSREGWGYFLIERIVPHPLVPGGESHHSIELFLYREGSGNRD